MLKDAHNYLKKYVSLKPKHLGNKILGMNNFKLSRLLVQCILYIASDKEAKIELFNSCFYLARLNLDYLGINLIGIDLSGLFKNSVNISTGDSPSYTSWYFLKKIKFLAVCSRFLGKDELL